MEVTRETSESERQVLSRRPSKGKRVVVTKYSRHACAQCKKAKTKCEGGKPVCERCQKTGHECNWTLEDARRPLTRAHEQALKHQNALLRSEVERLTREVQSLRLNASPGSGSSNPPSVAGLSSPGPQHMSTSSGDQHLAASYSESPISGSQSAPGVSSQQDASSAEVEETPLWGLVPVEDIASDAQEDIDIGGSDSEDNMRGPETDFDCDVESAYGSDEDSDDSDVDVDKALVAPTKTLFTEQDDIHHYGFTSVFRLRRPASHRELARRPYKGNDSAASGYDSASSSQGIRLRRNGPRSLRSFLSSSSANEAAPSIRVSQSQFNLSHKANASRESGMLKRDRRGKRRLQSGTARTQSPIRTQRHILLVGDLQDGAWKGCECQSDCWNRWLPKGVPLSRREHDGLIDRVFLFFTSWCMRVIPEYFLRDMYSFLHPALPHPSSSFTQKPSTSLPRLAHYSPFLHNMLLAVGTAFSTDPDIRKAETRARFADEGKAYIEEECSRPNISTVQALGLLASYYSGQGQQTLGFTYFGMSARIAQALGLFADCTPLLRAGRLRSWQVFDRTWCFHMAAAQDACWSMYVGRECGIPLPPAKKQEQTKKTPATTQLTGDSENLSAEVIIKEPLTFSMEDPFCLGIISEGGIGQSLDMMTWRMRGTPGADGVPHCKTFTTLQWSCQLMKISRSIMDLMNRLASSDSGTEIKLLVADIDIQLDAWRQDLPAELKLTPANEMAALPHKLMMHSAFWWQHILLHRPFYQRHRAKSMDSLFSVTRCNVAAREILYILRLWSKIYGTVRYCPITLIQTIFAAGTIYILQAMQAATGRRPATQSQASALDNLEELVRYLRECSESWEAAIRIADIFEKLLKEHRRVMEGATTANMEKRNARKKRRRLEMLKEDESAVSAAQSALLSPAPILSDARTDGSGYEELSSPAIQPSSSTSSSFPHPISPSDSLQTLFSPSVQTYPNVSPVFSSPDTAFSFALHSHNVLDPSSNDGGAQQQLSGASIPSYPTGYLSDDSYMSDAAPYMNMDDWTLSMNASLGQPASGFDADLSFLLNSEVGNMDAVMPGMSMFDAAGLQGLTLGAVTTEESACSDSQTNVLSEVGGGVPYATADSMEGVASGPDDIQSGINFESMDEDDRALYSMLAALSNQQQC